LDPFLSIIVPAHNEQARLPVSLPQIRQYLEGQDYTWEVIVVDSGSTDRTTEVARELDPRQGWLRLLRADRPGKGLAVRTGMLAARGAYRFICDADLSMPIEEVNRFLPPTLENVDIAIASREARGAIRYGEPFHRHWFGRVFNLLVRVLAVPGFHDTQCGFKCLRADVARDLFRVQQLDGWTFDVELLFIALKRGYRVVEVPIPWYYTSGSRVSLIRDSLAMLNDLFIIRRNWRRGIYAANP